jgi:hypothetical protein
MQCTIDDKKRIGWELIDVKSRETILGFGFPNGVNDRAHFSIKSPFSGQLHSMKT